MSWQFVSILQSIFGALSIIAIKVLSKNGNKYVYSVVFLGFVAEFLAAISYALFSQEVIRVEWSAELVVLLILGGIGFGIANFLVFDLFRRVPATIGSIQLSLNRVAAVIFAFIFLSESLTTKQLSGAALMILAVAIASYTKKHSHSLRHSEQLHMSKAVFVLVVMSMAYALGSIAEKKLLDRMGMVSYVVVGWGFQTLVVGGIVLLKRKKWRMPPSKIYPIFLLYVILYAVSGVLFVYALQLSDSSSKTIAASGLKVVLSVIFAYTLLKERKSIKRIIVAIIVSVIGLWLLF